MLLFGLVTTLLVLSGWIFSIADAALVNHMRQTVLVTFANANSSGVQEGFKRANLIIAPAESSHSASNQQMTRVKGALIKSVRSEQTTSGGAVSVAFRRMDFYTTTGTATACIQLPDNADWLPVAHLVVDGEKMLTTGWRLLNAKDLATYSASYRCYEFDFLLQVDTTDTSKPLDAVAARQIDFSVEKLVTALPEVITKEDCEKAQQKLRENTAGIAVVCKPAGSGLFAFEVLKKPEAMPDVEVQRVVIEALSRSVTGPWTISILKP